MNLVSAIYANPRFMVEVEGTKSSWKRQRSGIRQGCPLSPYLFIMIMSRVFQQVDLVKRAFCGKLKNENFRGCDMTGIDFSEILFADDTLIFAEESASLEAMLWAVESVSAAYGLRLNRTKCVILSLGVTPEICLVMERQCRSKILLNT